MQAPRSLQIKILSNPGSFTFKKSINKFQLPPHHHHLLRSLSLSLSVSLSLSLSISPPPMPRPEEEF